MVKVVSLVTDRVIEVVCHDAGDWFGEYIPPDSPRENFEEELPTIVEAVSLGKSLELKKGVQSANPE